MENVKCVICYDYPLEVDTYVHRVGRTARGERAGTAITLLEKKEVGGCFVCLTQMHSHVAMWSRSYLALLGCSIRVLVLITHLLSFR